MLIKCPECELQVSDKAVSCPHCGLPMRAIKSKITKSKPKHMRLPNGFGRISEIKGRNLRKPFRVMVTVGVDPNGKPIGKMLKPDGYFATYNEAYEALCKYNKNPYDLQPAITCQQLYEQWSEEYFKTLKSASSERTITSAWNKCGLVYKMRVKDVKARHIKGCMESCESANMKSRVKSLFNLMLDYALEYEIVDKNYARTFKISDDIIEENTTMKNSHICFTQEELDKLWEYKDDRNVRTILIQCYSGWRPQELGLITRENVNINEMTFTGGMKTKAGTNRTVPIHEKIKGLVIDAYNEEHEFLLTDENGQKLSYDKYHHRFDKVIKELNLNPEHKAHDGRKTFVTLAKKYNCDEYAIKYIVGHSISDLTEKVYTDRDLNFLKAEMAKIK